MAQHAISVEALQYLESQTDAKGRRLEVIKMPLPPPLHISKEESAGVAKVDGSAPREVRPSVVWHVSQVLCRRLPMFGSTLACLGPAGQAVHQHTQCSWDMQERSCCLMRIL